MKNSKVTETSFLESDLVYYDDLYKALVGSTEEMMDILRAEQLFGCPSDINSEHVCNCDFGKVSPQDMGFIEIDTAGKVIRDIAHRAINNIKEKSFGCGCPCTEVDMVGEVDAVLADEETRKKYPELSDGK